MNPFVRRDDAAVYALGAVPDGERGAFERLMAADPFVASDVERYARVAALLAWAAPPAEPSAALRSRILQRASGSGR